MPALLSIQVFSDKDFKENEIGFFNSDEWTKESELQLVQTIHDLLALVRPLGKSLNVVLDVEVTDTANALFLLNKKLNRPREINVQQLSVREIEVLGLIMEGCTNNEIAAKLFISYETVKSHRKNILVKSGARNTASLIHYYHQTFFDK